MTQCRRKGLPFYLLPSLWGLDVALAAFCWAMAFTEQLGVAFVGDGPVLLMVVSVWVCTIAARVYNAVRYGSGWYSGYYVGHAVPMVLVALCATAAAVWMILCYIGRNVLPYTVIPVLLLGLSGISPRRHPGFSKLCKALAFSFACMAPAFSMSCGHTPLHIVFCAPGWYMGVLFFLFLKERADWNENPGVPRQASLFLSLGLFILMAACVIKAATSMDFEHDFSLTIAIGAALLTVLAKLRPGLGGQTVFCLCWPVMAMPAVLSYFVFPAN